MAITSLSEVQNDYGSYRGNSLVGKLGAVTSVPNDGLEGIIGKPYPFLNGILVKIGGNIYTDSGYLNALKSSGNPYLSKRSLPTVSLRLSDVTQLVPDIIVHGSITRTKYAEVSITKRMSTIEDILRYLNDFFNPNTTDTVLTPQTLGSFNLITTDYFPDLDVSGKYPGLEFETFEDIATATVATISTPPTVTEPKTAEVRPVVEVEEEKPLVISKPKTKPKLFGITNPSSDFLLNDTSILIQDDGTTAVIPLGDREKNTTKSPNIFTDQRDILVRGIGFDDEVRMENIGGVAQIANTQTNDRIMNAQERLVGGTGDLSQVGRTMGLYSGNNFGKFTI